MLSWRLKIGIPMVLGLLFLAFLDMYLSDQLVSFWVLKRIPRGIILFPLFLVVIVMLCDEVLDLLAAVGVHPRRSTVYICNLGVVAICWGACIWQQYKLDQIEDTTQLITTTGWDWASAASVWTLVACALSLIVAFAAEIARFKEPGGNVINLAGAILAVVYIGVLATFLIQLRIAFGLAALFSLIVVAKAGDTGAFVIGRMIGRTKMSPGISPGKTIEGLIGGLLCGLLAAWFWFKVVIPIAASKTWLIEDTIMKTPTYGWVLFGLGVAGAGVLGDLAESLIKRDARRKDSSRWLPGFGGVLDLLDSLLIAAPVAYACWVFRLVCPGYH